MNIRTLAKKAVAVMEAEHIRARAILDSNHVELRVEPTKLFDAVWALESARMSVSADQRLSTVWVWP